jgi:hypothetical protein
MSLDCPTAKPFYKPVKIARSFHKMGINQG